MKIVLKKPSKPEHIGPALELERLKKIEKLAETFVFRWYAKCSQEDKDKAVKALAEELGYR